MTKRAGLRQIGGDTTGQVLIEAAFTLPILLLVSLAIVEIGVAQLDSHTVTTLTREGSNLISRSTPLQTAAQAVQSMSNGPVDFGDNAKVIFSVIKRGATTGTANYDKLVLYQRYEYGSGPGSSRLAGSGSFGPAPDYVAANSDDDTGLQVSNLPLNTVSVVGGLVYVTEVFVTRSRFTPLQAFGVNAPESLYAVAYF